jgi:hypothetical protein
MTALMRESQEDDYDQLLSELKSLKEVRKAHQRHLHQYQNLMHLVNTIKAGDERLDELHKKMCSFEKAMEAQHKRVAQMQRGMQSRRIMVDRSLSVPTEQMVGDPASMKSLVKMGTPRDTGPSNKRKTVLISKIPVNVEPLPYAKPVGCKRVYREVCKR